MTVRAEYVKCCKPKCDKLHGPYLYNYFYENKKLKKKYISLGTLQDYKLAEEYQNNLNLKTSIKEIIKKIRMSRIDKCREIAGSKGFTDGKAIGYITQEMTKKYLDYNNAEKLDDFLNQQLLTLA